MGLGQWGVDERWGEFRLSSGGKGGVEQREESCRISESRR